MAAGHHLKGRMEQKLNKPKRHLYLHKPPPQKRYSALSIGWVIFLVILAVRILSGLIK